MSTAVPVEQAPSRIHIGLEVEIWLVCHVALKLKLIKRVNSIQSKTSDGRGCNREI